MTLQIHADKTLDCIGLACPMPIVKTKRAMDELNAGQVIEVQATDKGSLADIQGWAKNTGHEYLGTIEVKEIMKHYLRKSSPKETKEEKKHPYSITNEELESKLAADEKFTILDVREQAEYAFNRITGAKSIPLGDLDERLHELNSNEEIYVICRTGARSDLACQRLAEKGYNHVKNVLPGMVDWKGRTEKNK